MFEAGHRLDRARFTRLVPACPPRSEVSQRQYNARRFRTVDVQDLFEDSRRAPVSRLAPGYTVYRRPRMAEEGVPANAELV